MKKFRMKLGAPPDSELSVRYSVSRTYEPKAEDYKSDSNPNGVMSKLGYLIHDDECIREGWYMPDELLNFSAPGYEETFELVDKDGTVWSEEYDDGEPDPDEIKVEQQ